MGISINSLRGKDNGHTWPLYNFLTNLLLQTPLEVVLPCSPSSAPSRAPILDVSVPPLGRTEGLSPPRFNAVLGVLGTPRRLPPPLPPFPQPALIERCVASASERMARPPHLTAVEGPVAGYFDATYPDGPPGSCSNRDRHCQRPALPGISSTLRLA